MSLEKKKFQIQKRIEKFVSANDKLAKTIFNLPANEYRYIIEKGECDFATEKIIRGKKVRTYFWLKVIGVPEKEKLPTHFEVEGIGIVNISRPLNEFDRDVFDACISAQEAGFKFATVNFLFRVMTGDSKKKATPEEKAAILESIGKMIVTQITIDFSETREKIPKYNSAPPRLVGAILPCQYLDGVEVNGQSTAIVSFLAESPLLIIARAKNKQILSYSAALFNIPNQNNTPLVTKIKSYVIRRVNEIIKHKNLRSTITFKDVFNHCDLTDATKWQKQDAREIIFDVMSHLKLQGVIRNFEKKKDGRAYSAISFSF